MSRPDGGVAAAPPLRLSGAVGMPGTVPALCWFTGFALAFPDFVPINLKMGIQFAFLPGLALLATALATRQPLVFTATAKRVGLLLLSLGLSAGSLLLAGSAVAPLPTRVLAWLTQSAQFAAMAACALGVWFGVREHPNGARAVRAGLGAGLALTVGSGLVLYALALAGVRLELPHNNGSYNAGIVWVPTVSVRSDGDSFPRLYGFFKEPSFLSAYVAPLATFYGVLAAARPRGRRLLPAAASVGAVVVLLLSGGRTGQLALALALPLVWLMLRGHVRLAQLWVPIALAAGPAILIGASLLQPASVETADYSVLQRAIAAVVAFRLFLAHPLIGIGYGNYGFHYVTFLETFADVPALYAVIEDQVLNASGVIVSYNLTLRFLAELGVLGFGALLALAWQLVGRAVRSRIPSAIAAAAASCCFLFAGIDSFVMFQFWVFLVLAQPEAYAWRRGLPGGGGA